jgi:hypothetical protein
MIIGFAKHGKGASGPALDYLTGYLVNGEARDPKPEVVRGDPRVVAEIIDSLPFQCRYTSGVLSFAAEDRVTPAMQEDVMNRFENAVFAGLTPDRWSIVWIKHADKGRTELHFVVPRVDLGTGKSLNVAPPTPASRHLLDTLREAINRRYGFRDPGDPECARNVSLPAHVAKLAAQARRHSRTARVDIRQSIANRIEKLAEAGTIQSRAGVVAYLRQEGFSISRAGINYLTVVHPGTGERVRLKGNLFRENFCPRDLNRPVRANNLGRLAALERRLEQLVAKRTEYHLARYGATVELHEPMPTINHLSYDRTRNPSHQRFQTIGTTIPPARSNACEHTGRFVEAAGRWCRSERELELATVVVENATRTVASRVEPALTAANVQPRTVASPYHYQTITPSARIAVLHDRDDDLEPDLDMEFP